MSTSHSIITRLIAAHYAATVAQVESLAHERYTSNVAVLNADGTYLRIALVDAQSNLGRPRGRGAAPNAEAQLTVLTKTHEKFYPAVLKGVTTDDIAVENGLDPKEQSRRALERNSRSAFARSAMSTLTAYVRAGGDLRTLDAETVTKASLRAATAPTEPTDKVARQVQRASGMLLRAVTRRAREHPDEAREEIGAVMDELQRVLDSLGNGDEEHEETTTTARPPRDAGSTRTRVGVPQFHRGA